MMEFLILQGLCMAGMVSSIDLNMPDLLSYTFVKFQARYQTEPYLNNTSDDREAIYNQRVQQIVQHNELAQNNTVTYTLGINRFTAMNQEELQEYGNSFNPFDLFQKGTPFATLKNDNDVSSDYYEGYFNNFETDCPESIDWREKNAVTHIKDQKSCLACYAFSAVAAIESAFAIKTGNLVALSEQEIVDCSTSYKNKGCTGGNSDNVYRYVMENGITKEEEYPYQNEAGTCQRSNKYTGASIKDTITIECGNENEMKRAVLQAPLAAAMHGTLETFFMYNKGIYNDPKCSSTKLDHGVLVVGYGTENGNDYWIIKNCWGTDWGNGGYAQIARNKNNHCGIATLANYPLAY